MPMPSQSIRYCSYLLRCWNEAPHIAADMQGWRFSLEDPHTGVRRGFASFDSLVAFLRETLSDDLCDGEDAPAGEQTDEGTLLVPPV